MHEQALEKREEEIHRELYEVRQQLRLARQIRKHKDTLEEWQRSGIPDPRRPDTRSTETSYRQEGESGSGPKPARKQRIIALLAQDPQRRWKTREVADGLDDPRVKSVRVALDEMTRAEALIKHPDATYQYPQHSGDTRKVF